MKDDQIIEAGRKAYQKMASDRTANTRDVAIDRLYVENAVTAMVHNLALVDEQLADPARFPTDTATSDARATLAMKAQLTAIAAQQKKALDLLSGALETSNFNTMQNPTDGDGPAVAHNRSSLSGAPGELQNPNANLDMTSGGPDDTVADAISSQRGTNFSSVEGCSDGHGRRRRLQWRIALTPPQERPDEQSKRVAKPEIERSRRRSVLGFSACSKGTGCFLFIARVFAASALCLVLAACGASQPDRLFPLRPRPLRASCRTLDSVRSRLPRGRRR